MMGNDGTAGIFDVIPPYSLTEGFLGADLISELLSFAAENESRFKDSTVGITAKDRVNPEIRVSSILRDFGPLKKEIKSRFNAALPEALNKLGMPGFELYHTELELVAHGNGAFYNRHIDTAIDRDDVSVRVLTAVYYFHAQPKRFTGGRIQRFTLRH